ncbi:MAG: hypothetical protein U0441_07315 [Polyangiaceae bacterium]
MTFLLPTPDQARAGLRAIKTTLLAGGAIQPQHREALSAVQRHLLRTSIDVDALPPIEPDDLAIQITDPALREQLVGALVTFSMLSDRVNPAHAAAVDAYAGAFGVAPVAVRQLRDLAEERIWRLRLDTVRNGPGGTGMARMIQEMGYLGTFKNMLTFAGLLQNEEMAARYRALRGYAEGTLGRALFDFYTSRGFQFPGEKGGAPEGLLSHDLTHILSGYDTDLHGEARVLAFTAGYQRQKVFGTLLFVVVLAQHDIRLTPLAPSVKCGLDSPHLVTEMVEAFARGARMTIDLSDGWDFWPLMDKPVDEVRRLYNIDVLKDPPHTERLPQAVMA